MPSLQQRTRAWSIAANDNRVARDVRSQRARRSAHSHPRSCKAMLDRQFDGRGVAAMTNFVTGATGFIGRHLLERLLERKGTIHCLVRKESLAKFKALREELGADESRLVAVVGDLAKPKLGVTPAAQKELGGKVKHFFHLAALYDLAADEASQVVANVEGTRHALEFAEAVKAVCFHHVSSIAAAGLYPGVFREDMFDE